MKPGKTRLQTWVKLTPGAEFLPGYITSPQVGGFTQSWIMMPLHFESLGNKLIPYCNHSPGVYSSVKY